MNDHDPVPDYERSHRLRRAIVWGILSFYVVTIGWAAFIAVVDQ